MTGELQISRAGASPGEIRKEEFLSIRAISRIVLILALAVVAPLKTGAQEDKKAEAQLRTVHGSVVDKNDAPVPSSVVYLVNTKTQAVRTYISDDAGEYRFSGLDPNVDYEVHAEHNDLQSSTRTVSSFDSRKDIEVVLKLAHKKPPR